MKATLEFTLPEEGSEHRMAIQAAAAHSVLWDFDQYLRDKLKHGQLKPAADEALTAARQELHDLLSGAEVVLDP